MKNLKTTVFALLFTNFFSPVFGSDTGVGMGGGGVYFELTSGAQKWSPSFRPDWSFRIGGGMGVILGNINASSEYTIAGIRHNRGEDFPQTLITNFRFGGGWIIHERKRGLNITPMFGVGHVSNRIMPEKGVRELIFDGWGVSVGTEARYLIHTTFSREQGSRSSRFWSAQYLKLQIHHTFAEKQYTLARLSYNVFFNAYQISVITEYNILEDGARGWVAGLELAFSWFNFR